jgi:hypothetical protein
MAIGRTFEESFQKALRMVDPKVKGFEPRAGWDDKAKVIHELKHPTDKRIFALGAAMYNHGMSVDEIHDITKIDKWFLYRLEDIVTESKKLNKMKVRARRGGGG